ncbi:MAG: hypothetical protein OEL89_01955 [Candidatus Peregrinibacteria bacterium]|nr:hypothetical protein [Candidatus Peregrinibacteria bacterium]
MNDERIFCGNGKVIKTQFGELTKLSFSAEDLEKMQANLENGWINVVVKERRTPSEKGTTHYCEVDKWKPDPNRASGGGAAPDADAGKDPSAEDLPF